MGVLSVLLLLVGAGVDAHIQVLEPQTIAGYYEDSVADFAPRDPYVVNGLVAIAAGAVQRRVAARRCAVHDGPVFQQQAHHGLMALPGLADCLY